MSSQIHAERAALKVFGIPELARLICGTIKQSENVSLMRTCRRLFHNILPLVWERVDKANQLVFLIPGSTRTITYDKMKHKSQVIRLPSYLDLSRFNIYAPYVKWFRPSIPYNEKYVRCESFLSCARSTELLPNLETIHLPVKYGALYESIDTDRANWVTAFLSSSLQTLELAYQESRPLDERAPWMKFDMFDNLMVAASQKCPRLRSLSILPASVECYQIHHRTIPPVFFLPISKDHSIFLLRNLTSLLVSSAILNSEALLALSALPSLEMLRIIGSQREHLVYCDGLELPAEGFPVLKHLELVPQSWTTIGNLCSVRPIVSGLHSLTIGYAPSQYKARYHSVNDIIPLLATNTSTITRLVVRHDFGEARLDPNVAQYWKRLPLISLHLEWTYPTIRTSSIICSIMSCLPLLEELTFNMDQRILDLRELRTIVEHLPCLRRIQAIISWDPVTELGESDFTPSRSQSNETLYLESEFHFPEPRQKNAEQLARYLSMLRPSAAIICQSYQKQRYCFISQGYIDLEGPKDTINAELSRLRLR
ncbi:unnamed protein product [Rhizoctonia solani]|uniref:F-box domain-containing protein n=1 Tax=Rhizoctonia solani TaxID=456999 RepID=A0A8H3E7X6_9AGAM|nr:unnamed protein product [Rhizoctonia solani]